MLLIIKELDLDPRSLLLILAGRIDEGDDRYNRLKKYFRGIKFMDSRKLLPFPDQFSSLPAHRYVSLLGLNICE